MFIQSSRIFDTVRERIGEPTIRQNAVLCVEMLLTKAKKKLTTTAKLLTRSNQKLLTRLELAEIKIKSQNIEIKIWKKKYLIGKRKLPSGLVDSWHNSGLIYADEKPNAVFLRRSMDEEKNHWG